MDFKRLRDKMKNIVVGRVPRYILFWVYVVVEVLRQSDNYIYPSYIYYIFLAITTLTVIVFAYLNNLVFLPKFILKKEYNTYAISIVSSVLVFSLLYTLTLKAIVFYFPQIKLYQISFITAPVSLNWSFSILLKETFGYVIIFGFIALIFTMSWYMTHYIQQEKIIEATKKKQIETELNFLKSQMNPHFLFNNLNNLYALAIKKSDKTPEIILKLSSLLRYLLYESNVEKISFEKEKEIMQAYIDLELLRLPDNKNMNFSIESDKNYEIPPLLWLPVLENVFKHGTRIISDSYFIDYKFVIHDNIATIYSKNIYKLATKNGSERKNHAGGMGITNLKKRLDLLYPDKHDLVYKNDNPYYIVEAKIQL